MKTSLALHPTSAIVMPNATEWGDIDKGIAEQRDTIASITTHIPATSEITVDELTLALERTFTEGFYLSTTEGGPDTGNPKPGTVHTQVRCYRLDISAKYRPLYVDKSGSIYRGSFVGGTGIRLSAVSSDTLMVDYCQADLFIIRARLNHLVQYLNQQLSAN